MKNEYLLQNEFTNWLNSQSELLCFKPLFYSSQISKLNKLAFFNDEEERLTDALENEIRCDNHECVEEIVLTALEKMEQSGVQNDLGIGVKTLEGLRLGVLKYRLFLHNFMAIRNQNDQTRNSIPDYFSEFKQMKLETLFKGKTRYTIPVYHDVFTYNKIEIDALWHSLLKSNTYIVTGSNQVHSTVNSDLKTMIVTNHEDQYLEILDGGNTLIILSLLLHVLTEFSESANKIEACEIKSLSRLVKFKTTLNEQKLFGKLVNNRINKYATNPSEISAGNLYRYKEAGLNTGYPFLQTTFRFVQLIQASKIPQSKHYIPDMDVFITNILKNISINSKQLSAANIDKTYLNQSTILLKHVLEWL